jgi:hypothetical protein
MLVPSSCGNIYYRRKITCPASGASAYSSPVIVSVACPITPPYTEDFESIATDNTFPSCMAATSIAPNVYTYTSATGSYNQTNHTPGGSKFASFRYASNDYLFTPALNLIAGKTYQFSFWYVTDGFDGWTTLAVKLGNSATTAAMTTTLGSLSLPKNATYKEFKIFFTPATSGTQYIGIYCNSNTTPWYLSIDDIGLQELPPCSGTPVAGTVISTPSRICGTGSPALSLSGTSAVTGLNYRWESSTTGAPGSFTPISSSSTTSTFTAAPISAPTYYRAIVTCAATGDSAISAPLVVNAGAFSTPYFENFEGIGKANDLPVCMSATSIAPVVYTYLSATGSYNQTNHTPGGNQFASFRYSANDYLFTPGINVIAGKTYDFSFWYVTDGLSGWNTLGVKCGGSATAAAMTTTLGTPLTSPKNTSYKQYKVRFIAATTGVQYFGIYCSAGSAPWYLSVDDIALQEIPPCAGTPTAGAPAANPARVCGSGTTVLDLPGLIPALGLTYVWEDSVAGGSWGTGSGRPSFGGTSVPFSSGTISAPTYFRCKVICGTTGDTAISAPLYVPAGAYDLPYTETFEGISMPNQLPDCMSATSIAPIVYTYLAPTGSRNQINHTPGGSKFASFRYGSADYLFTPPINVVAGYQYIFSFWYITDGFGGWDTLRVDYGNTASVAGMTNSMKVIKEPINTTYQQYIDTFIASTSGVYSFGIYTKANPIPWYLTVDDINIQPVPCFGMPDAGIILGTIPSGPGVCAGTMVTLRDSGATLPMSPGISYHWQRRASGSGLWSDIPHATDTVLSADTLSGWDYRFAVTCAESGSTAYSPIFRLPELAPHPPVVITPVGTMSFCLGDTVFLNATNYAGAVYTWKRNGSLVPGWAFSDLSATDSGIYTVTVYSPAAPCPTTSDSVVLQLTDPGYRVYLATPADSFMCAGDSILLRGSSPEPGVIYTWREDNVTIPGASGNSYWAKSTGTYRIVADNGAAGCKALSRSINIQAKPLPEAVISIPASGTTACSNVGVTLSASIGTGYIYQWYRDGSPIYGANGRTELVTNNGAYSVRVRSSSGCAAYSGTVTITILPAPDPFIVASGLVLSTSEPYVTYQWYRNDVLLPGRTSDTLRLTHNGSFTVKVTDANGCEGVSPAFHIYDPGLGIGNLQLSASDIRLYPNPASEQVFIDAPAPVHVSVKDITGRVVMERKQATTIPMTPYADGVYIFTITDNDNRVLKIERIQKKTTQ